MTNRVPPLPKPAKQIQFWKSTKEKLFTVDSFATKRAEKRDTGQFFMLGYQEHIVSIWPVVITSPWFAGNKPLERVNNMNVEHIFKISENICFQMRNILI